MLLEAFVNRYRKPGVAPIHFATIVLPLTMILGALICFAGTPMVIIMAVCDIYPEIFSPKLSMVCALAGGGLFLAPLAIGGMHGLIREKQRGIEREGYGPKMMAHLFMLGIALPFPALYGAKFFYNYPFARYPSYILEVKPSPELKAEIERFGLAEIKWHTPYDYSLERQVIRYDFGEPIDGDWTSDYSKWEIFDETVSQINGESVSSIAMTGSTYFRVLGGGYPFVAQVDYGENKCVLNVEVRKDLEELYIAYSRNGDQRKVPLIIKGRPDVDGFLLDLSSAFDYYKKDTALGFSDNEFSCAMRASHGPDYLFFVSKVFFPILYKNIHSYQKTVRLGLNFRFEHFVGAIRNL